MPTNKWILPEGIEDILPEQAYWLEQKRREVIDTFLSYGYGLVIPPMIEYHDSLLSNSSEDLDLQTFKLIDQETGKQLGLRADITSQISRIYSTYDDKNKVNRYCYFDHVVRTKNVDSKESRIPIQAEDDNVYFIGVLWKFSTDTKSYNLIPYSQEGNYNSLPQKLRSPLLYAVQAEVDVTPVMYPLTTISTCIG